MRLSRPVSRAAGRTCQSTPTRRSSRRTSPRGSWKTTVKTLNVAGNREHEEPGIGDRVEQFLIDVLVELGHARV